MKIQFFEKAWERQRNDIIIVLQCKNHYDDK